MALELIKVSDFPKIENPDGVEWFPLGLPDGTAVAINIDDFKTYMGFAASANYKGNATPSTDPGTPAGPEFYTATEVGTYTNFDGIEVEASDAFVLLSYDGSAWSKAVVNIDLSAYATKEELDATSIQITSVVDPGKDVAGQTLSGYISNADGSFVANAAWVSTGYIPVVEQTKVRRVGSAIGGVTSVALVAFYDAAKQYLGYWDVPVLDDESRVVKDYFENARYIRASSGVSDGLSVYLDANLSPTVIEGLADAMNNVDRMMEDKDFAFDAPTGYYDDSGNLKPGANWRRTDIIPVSEGDSVGYLGITSGSVAAIVGWDENMENPQVIAGTVNTAVLLNYTIPSGVSNVAASARMTPGDQFEFVIKVPKTDKLDAIDQGLNDVGSHMPKIVYGQIGTNLKINPFGVIAKRGVDIIWDRERGNQEFLDITPESDDISVTLRCRNGYNEIKLVGTMTIKSSSAPVSPSADQFFITLGDSTTLGVSASGIEGAWPNECSRRLTGIGTELLTGPESPAPLSLSNISFIGTIGDQPIKCEGRGGWRYDDYLYLPSKGSVSNAFYNPSTEMFDLNYYISQNGFTGIDPTGSNLTMIIQLGWNHVYSDDMSAVRAWAEEMIESIHASRAGAKIKLLGLAGPPDLNVKNYNGIRNVSPESVMRDAVIPYSDLCQSLADNYAYVEFIDIAPVFFPRNSYPYQDWKVSPRDPSTVRIYSDYVHPNATGYAQIADAVFYNILYNYCQAN